MELTVPSSLNVLGTGGIFFPLRQRRVTDGRSYFGIGGAKSIDSMPKKAAINGWDS
jgi:hypothetical protein